MIYEVCETCAARTTDIEKHMQWHGHSPTEEADDADN